MIKARTYTSPDKLRECSEVMNSEGNNRMMCWFSAAADTIDHLESELARRDEQVGKLEEAYNSKLQKNREEVNLFHSSFDHYRALYTAKVDPEEYRELHTRNDPRVLARRICMQRRELAILNKLVASMGEGFRSINEELRAQREFSIKLELQDNCRVIRQALGIYADPKNWGNEGWKHKHKNHWKMDEDGWHVARQALKHTKAGKTNA